ncbi:unnamed protein product [Lepidochelys olivacea]
MLQAGVPGFKCSLIASGVEEFPHVSLQDLHMAMNGQGTHRHPTTPMNVASKSLLTGESRNKTPLAVTLARQLATLYASGVSSSAGVNSPWSPGAHHYVP